MSVLRAVSLIAGAVPTGFLIGVAVDGITAILRRGLVRGIIFFGNLLA